MMQRHRARVEALVSVVVVFVDAIDSFVDAIDDFVDAIDTAARGSFAPY